MREREQESHNDAGLDDTRGNRGRREEKKQPGKNEEAVE